jgi:hypothetical protein
MQISVRSRQHATAIKKRKLNWKKFSVIIINLSIKANGLFVTAQAMVKRQFLSETRDGDGEMKTTRDMKWALKSEACLEPTKAHFHLIPSRSGEMKQKIMSKLHKIV